MLTISHLEWHVTHSCNFTCQGCGHYTNDGYRQNFSLDLLEKWYLSWNKRIRPLELSMLGGEPLLNKQIVDIIYMTKEVWDVQDDQELELVSNGLLFDRVPGLTEALKKNKCILTITKHSKDLNYVRLFEKSISKIIESGVNYRIHDASNYWLKTYSGYGSSIEPLGTYDYKKSWDNCPGGQNNFTLNDFKIYKCAPLAYLPVQKQKYGDKLSSKWNPYLRYKPLLPTDSDIKVIDFFSRQEEPVCSMCPNNTKMFEKISPLHSSNYMNKIYGNK